MKIKKFFLFIGVVIIALAILSFGLLVVRTFVDELTTLDFPENVYISLDETITIQNGEGIYVNGDTKIEFITNIKNGNVHIFEFSDIQGQGQFIEKWEYIFTCEKFMIYHVSDDSIFFDNGRILIFKKQIEE